MGLVGEGAGPSVGTGWVGLGKCYRPGALLSVISAGHEKCYRLQPVTLPGVLGAFRGVVPGVRPPETAPAGSATAVPDDMRRKSRLIIGAVVAVLVVIVVIVFAVVKHNNDEAARQEAEMSASRAAEASRSAEAAREAEAAQEAQRQQQEQQQQTYQDPEEPTYTPPASNGGGNTSHGPALTTRTMGPFGGLMGCEDNASRQPVGASECYVGPDNLFYYDATVQAG